MALLHLHWRKKPLNMFLVKIPKEEDTKNILEIKEYDVLIVKVKKAKNKKLVTKCHRCQVFGHT